MLNSLYLYSSLLTVSLLSISLNNTHADAINSEKHAFTVDIVVEGLKHPWGVVFLSNSELLVTERPGRLRVVRDGMLLEQPVSGLPAIKEVGQGGLLGIVLHPEFHTNRWVYLAYAGKGKGGYGTEVMRGQLNGMHLSNIEVIFRALPKSRGGRHFGSRLLFASDGTLYVSLGDRGDRERAQDINDHAGSLIRINDDGSIPVDNPFVTSSNARKRIYTYGNRNMQGMVLQPDSNLVWTHEHGPQGGDEINIMRRGLNYGWPVITYGVNYGIGTRIGKGTHKEGMEQPVYYWVPSIAPSGMAFYTGNKFPGWQGNLFVGSLKFGFLARLELQGEKVIHEERLLNNRYGRIRDIIQGPDELLYLLTDERNGQLLRLRPVSLSRSQNPEFSIQN